jgi:hypothetical protein
MTLALVEGFDVAGDRPVVVDLDPCGSPVLEATHLDVCGDADTHETTVFSDLGLFATQALVVDDFEQLVERLLVVTGVECVAA